MKEYKVSFFDFDTCANQEVSFTTSRQCQFDALMDITSRAMVWAYNHEHFNYKIVKIEYVANDTDF